VRRAAAFALCAFALAELSLLLAGALAGEPALSVRSRWRGDSEHYLSIAERGYQLRRCRPDEGYVPGAFCGNDAWFPGYSGAAAVLARAGVPLEAAGLLVALACELLLLALAFGLLTAEAGLRVAELQKAAPALLLVALFPGFVYRHAIFPISLYLLALLLFAWLLSRERWAAAGTLGAVAALVYSTGFVAAAVAAAWALRPGATRDQRRGALLAAALASLGLAVALGAMWLGTGAPDAFFLVQARYGHHGLANPLDTWLSRLKPLVNPRYRALDSVITALQSLLAGALIVWTLVAFWRGPQRRDPLRGLLALLSAALWTLPLLIGGQLSLYRAEAALLPAALLLPELPRRAQWGFVIGAALLAVPMGYLFFRVMLT
jgi:hypothetical protein